MGTKFTRCRIHDCGAFYREADIYPRFVGGSADERAPYIELEKQESSLAQKNLNDRNARRHLLQLIPLNFTPETGTHTTLTYKDKFLPQSEEQALADRANYLRRIKRECKKQGLSNPKFIAVTEYQLPDENTKTKEVRYHHHIILECGLDRDTLEALWSRGQGKKRERLGRANADRLQFEHGNCEALATYLLKYPKRRRRWTQSLHLKQPKHRSPQDNKYTNRQIEKLCTSGQVYNAEYWEKQYKGWTVADVQPIFDERVGWSIYLKLYKPRRPCPQKQTQQQVTRSKRPAALTADAVKKR